MPSELKPSLGGDDEIYFSPGPATKQFLLVFFITIIIGSVFLYYYFIFLSPTEYYVPMTVITSNNIEFPTGVGG
jgi:hypothetical protein